MQLPAYLLPRPALTLDKHSRAACAALLEECSANPGQELTDRLPLPPWQFCCYLADSHPVLIHGSKTAGMTAIAPRQSVDSNPFGNRSAVFAASDGIWPMFFALLDRQRFELSLVNGCFRVVQPDGQRSAPYYFFSVTQDALPLHPWSDGFLYLLPRESFEQHPPRQRDGVIYEALEWASLEPVRPLAWIRVRPADFPFLAQVRGHDPLLVAERAAADPRGWPWLDTQ